MFNCEQEVYYWEPKEKTYIEKLVNLETVIIFSWSNIPYLTQASLNKYKSDQTFKWLYYVFFLFQLALEI